MPTVRLAQEAMRTRFEIVLSGDAEPALIAAGEEALAEIARVERQLSAYDDESDLFAVNALAHEHPVRVRPTTLAFLQTCADLSAQTDGAFDPTVGPLLALWRGGAPPESETLEAVRQQVGWERIVLDAENSTVAFTQPGPRLDPGAIGKGWALDRAAELLQEAGVTRALLHGGTSSVIALGADWPIALADGPSLSLSDQALGLSAPDGRWRALGESPLGHVLDPRTGAPIAAPLAWAAVVGPSATIADALSTALLVLGDTGRAPLAARFPGYDFLCGGQPAVAVES